LIKREFNEGHIVASHTFSHPTVGITKFSDAELTKDLKDLNDLLYDLIQVKPAFFRPPLGEYSPANEKVIEAQGFTAVSISKKKNYIYIYYKNIIKKFWYCNLE